MKLEDFKMHEDDKWDKNIVSTIIDGGYGKDFTGMVVVDIGANIGGFTCVACETAKKVYAFEPNKGNFDLLKQNTKKFKNVEIFNCGLGDEGVRTLYGYGGNYGNFSLSDGDENGRPPTTREDIEVKSFKGFNIGHIDFLKCDCEGAEYEIFKDDIQADKMIIEAHFVNTQPEKMAWLIKTLQERGYNVEMGASYASSARMLYVKKG